MKKLLFCIITFSSFCLSSCNKDPLVQSSSNVNQDKVILLNKEKVTIPDGVDPSAISVSSRKDAANYVYKVLNNAGGKAKNLTELDPDALQKILLELIKKYPSFDFSLEKLPEDHLAMIRRDFPDIKTPEDAYNKRETIALYYENLMRYEFVEKIKSTNIPTRASGRSSSLFDTEALPGGWGWLAATYPEACGIAGSSALDINNEVRNRFGCEPSQNDSDDSNAFKHSGWCGLIGRRMIARGWSKDNGIGQASIVTAAYECISINFDPSQPNNIFQVQNRGVRNVMDLWNNSVGRSYVYHNTTFGLFGIRQNFPSEQRVLDEMFDRGCTQHEKLTFYNAYEPPNVAYDVNASPAPLLNWVQADHNAAWTTLYRHTASNWTKLMTIKFGCNCPQ